jgi:hypothetical protein
MHTATPMIERRAVPRRRVLKAGAIAYDGGGTICTVRNLSPNGARIDLANPLGLPSSFTLVIRTDNIMRRCRPIWRSGNQLGVAFE